MKTLLLSLFLMTALFARDERSLEPIITSTAISAKIKDVAEQINHDYEGKELIVMTIMKGAICVTADLIRAIDIPFQLSCIKVSSYGLNGRNAGELTIEGWDRLDIAGKDVLLVDDIFETGNTLKAVIDRLQAKQPKSLKSLTLLVKEVPRNTSYRPDYVLFDIPNRFVVGYGLDYKELYRGLPGVYAFIDDTPPF